jgi:hypothetical protein
MMTDLKQNIPAGETDIPILSQEEINYLRNLAVTAAGVRCRWMIDTKMNANHCRCHLAECNHPESPIYRNRTPTPFRWKEILCNLNNCRFFEQ